MNVYTIQNWSTGEKLDIKAIYAERDPKTKIWEFATLENNNKVALCYYNGSMWDIRKIKYGN